MTQAGSWTSQKGWERSTANKEKISSGLLKLEISNTAYCPRRNTLWGPKEVKTKSGKIRNTFGLLEANRGI